MITMLQFQDGMRKTAEAVDLLIQEAGESCRAIELYDGYLAALINPCLGPEEDRVARLILAAPDMLMLLEAAISGDLSQDFRNRANAVVSSVRGETGQDRDGSKLGSQAGHARD